MPGPGSIHGFQSSHSLPSDRLDSKAANGVREEQREQRHAPGAWPESVGNNDAKGGFDPAALTKKLIRFLARHGETLNQKPDGIEQGSPASRQPGTAHRISEAAGAVGRLATSGADAYEAAKPLLQVAKAGKAAPLALVAVAISMIPQLKDSLSEFVEAGRDLLNAASDKRPR